MLPQLYFGHAFSDYNSWNTIFVFFLVDAKTGVIVECFSFILVLYSHLFYSSQADTMDVKVVAGMGDSHHSKYMTFLT